MKKYPLYGYEIELSDSILNYTSDKIKYENLKSEIRKKIIDAHKKLKTIENVIEYFDKMYFSELKKYADFWYKKLLDAGFANLTLEKFLTFTYKEREPDFFTVHNAVISLCEKIEFQENSEKHYRDIRKEARGRWEGGGFGLKGAIKGVMAAGALNMVSGALHDVINTLGNVDSERVSKQKKEDLMSKCIEGYLIAIENDCKYIFETYIQINIEILNIQYKVPTSSECFDAVIKLSQMSKDASFEVVLPLVQEIFNTNPFSDIVYQRLFDIYGDEENELETIAGIFGCEKVFFDYKLEKNIATNEEKMKSYRELIDNSRKVTTIKEIEVIKEKFEELSKENPMDLITTNSYYEAIICNQIKLYSSQIKQEKKLYNKLNLFEVCQNLINGSAKISYYKKDVDEHIKHMVINIVQTMIENDSQNTFESVEQLILAIENFFNKYNLKKEDYSDIYNGVFEKRENFLIYDGVKYNTYDDAVLVSNYCLKLNQIKSISDVLNLLDILEKNIKIITTNKSNIIQSYKVFTNYLDNLAVCESLLSMCEKVCKTKSLKNEIVDIIVNGIVNYVQKQINNNKSPEYLILKTIWEWINRISIDEKTKLKCSTLIHKGFLDSYLEKKSFFDAKKYLSNLTNEIEYKELDSYLNNRAKEVLHNDILLIKDSKKMADIISYAIIVVLIYCAINWGLNKFNLSNTISNTIRIIFCGAIGLDIFKTIPEMLIVNNTKKKIREIESYGYKLL